MMEIPRSTVQKQDLRATLRRRRNSVSAQVREEAALALVRHAGDLGALVGSGTLSAFWPLPDEIDVRPLMVALHDLGIRIALPVVARPVLVFRSWQPADPLVPAGFGLSEPAPSAPEVRPSAMLVPLLGFDRRGHRLGYGQGHYDRAITACEPRLTIGVAFACQEVAVVPIEPHDQPVHRVLTERGLVDCAPLKPQ
jgi:5-formyltetrahydrofolate cyclo-ligase